ncbi:DNA polymerase [Flavobacterium sp. ABG]|uniref:DNA polymerase n=1 Tax=Flavobacterium sp. ABG TaxID=1423322 RepID=UPI00069CB35C|nr:DNA polymerase [Flavobacterium sp. ABG]
MNDTIINIEHQLIPVLVKMELEGVKIDVKKLSNVELELNELSNSTKMQIQQLSNSEVNLKSSEQVSQLLFEDLKIQPKISKKSKSDYYSVDKSHLNKLLKDHEIIPLLLDYRKITSLLQFCDQLKEVNSKTKRLHGNFNQIGTATGRFSCSKPNLQNIPNVKVKAEEKNRLKVLESKFREVFIPENDCQFVGADYSQIELRAAAEMSQDPFLLKAYNEDLDIHILTASEIFKVKFNEVSNEQRSIAKSINFGLIYGKTANGLAESLTEITKKSHSVEQAQKVMDDYFKRFSGVKSFLDGLIVFADKYGYSKTLYGRKRPIPELSSSKMSEREKGKRLAMNSPIQGSAADIIKMAMIACDRAIIEKNLKSKLVLQVHDELLFEVPDDEVSIMEKLVKNEMENAVKLSIPLKVELSIGKNWAMAH